MKFVPEPNSEELLFLHSCKAFIGCDKTMWGEIVVHTQSYSKLNAYHLQRKVTGVRRE